MLKTVFAAVLVAQALFASRSLAAGSDSKLDDSPLLLQNHTEATVVESEPGDWHFRVGFNLMAGAITGTAGHQKTEIDVDAGLDEILDNGTTGLEFNFEAGTSIFWWRALCALRMRAKKSATGSVKLMFELLLYFFLAGSTPKSFLAGNLQSGLPGRLGDARDLALQCQSAET